MAATIRDIREKTGLALATISKYLNGGNVLPENAKAISEAIEELHYEVNEVARGLATKKTRTIGVLIQSFENVFAGTLVSNIESILRQHNYSTIVCDSQGDTKLEEEALRFLISKRVDGIITIPTANDARYLKPVMEKNIPIVLIDRTFSSEKTDKALIDSGLIDNVKAAKEAVDVLLNHNHEKIAVICGDDSEYTGKKRLEGYKNALNERAIPIKQEYVKRGKLTVEHGFQSMKELLALENRPTAIFMTNYEITLGGILAINEVGLHFPEEISLIGFDNFMLAQIVKPALWMVTQPMEKIAVTAAELMLEKVCVEKMSGKKQTEIEDNQKIILETSIYEGKSIRRL